MTIQEIHVNEMEEKYSEEIKTMVSKTKFYTDDNVESKKIVQVETPNVSLVDLDTTSAVFKYATRSNRVCALNFASFSNPGGGYIRGSHAQEETLCADSCLYNVLSEFPDYYNYNRKNRNDGLYKNRALYTPQVIFEKDSMKAKCDIITCSSPNLSLFYGEVEDNDAALKERIRFILNIIRQEHPDTVILGAFGCGAFRQDPNKVANYFLELIDEYIPNDIEVVFAIPKRFKKNYDAFMNEMTKYIKA